MSEDDGAQRRTFNVEVSVGWNSPSPKVTFPESADSGDTSMNSSTNGGSVQDQPLPRFNDHPNTDILGSYSNLLPGSSPPRPRQRIRVRKRKPESPLRKQQTADSIDSMLANPPSIGKRKMTLPSEEDESDDFDLLAVIRGNQGAAGASAPVQPVPASSAQPTKAASLDSLIEPGDTDSDSESDLEDLIRATASIPIKFPSTYFTTRKALRLVVQRVLILPDSSLSLQCTKEDGTNCTVNLQGSWSESVVRRGDTIHVMRILNGNTPVNPEPTTAAQSVGAATPIVVNDSTDILVVINPDILVPCTSVAEALSCERQVVLRNQVRVPADLNENLVLGSIKHEFIQTCFTKDIITDKAAMQNVLRTAAEAYSLDLQLVDLDVATAMKKLLPIVPDIQRWAISVWGPRAAGRLVDLHGSHNTFKVRLNRIAYIEEEIRSPVFGLVGKIDVTCEAVDLNSANSNDGTRKAAARLVGLEIKTGKSTQSVSHRAQTSLYTLLLAERHPYNTHPWSLLYYTETGTTIAIVANVAESRALVQKRNKVAHELWLYPPGVLPPPTSISDAICNWCSRSNSCILYTAVADNGNTRGSSALAGVYSKAKEAGVLTPAFLKFIEHWHNLLELEHETYRRTEQLRERQWWLTSPEPAVLWRISGQIQSPMPSETTANNPPSASESGYVYKMRPESRSSLRSADAQGSSAEINDDGQLFTTESYVIVSTKQQMGITFGVVLASLPHELVVRVKDRLLPSGTYRVEADIMTSDSHLALARYNLNSLMDHDRLRELIVDLRAPVFTEVSSQKVLQSTVEWASNRVLPASPRKDNHTSLNASKFEVSDSIHAGVGDDDDVIEEHGNLNDDQTNALNKVLTARDYALILGMPGTGKTTTIAAIVASLVKRGKSVLLSAYTNSAVDTIVLKLLSAKVKCLRLATTRLENIHPDVIPVTVTPHGAAGNGASLTDFLEYPVVACTSHSSNNKLFALRNFDYCILDEASQITLPFCIGPIRLASKFVLVGDHYQLPPLVRNLKAKELGLTESLFKILCESHPEAVVELRKQYRMCADIMSLSNDLVYNGRLVCGTDLVARQKLSIDTTVIDKNFPNATAIDPEHRVVFLNTDSLGSEAFEQTHDEGTSNAAEAVIVSGLIDQLSQAGMGMPNVAVISLYRQQLAFLKQSLQKFVAKGLEILTADQAQGRDKDCIIVSLVKSNENGNSGVLLKEWRRLNVAFTRAKQKLVIVGSKRTMQQADEVSSFFEYIDNRKWVYDAKLK